MKQVVQVSERRRGGGRWLLERAQRTQGAQGDVYDNGPIAQVSSALIDARVRGLVEAAGPGSAQATATPTQVLAARRQGRRGHLSGAVPRARVHGAHERHRACARRRLRDLGRPPRTRAAPRSPPRASPGCRSRKVIVNTTLLGGGFGRRGELDFIVDAVETAKAGGRAGEGRSGPARTTSQHGFYRPATYNVFRAALGRGRQAAKPGGTAWSARGS